LKASNPRLDGLLEDEDNDDSTPAHSRFLWSRRQSSIWRHSGTALIGWESVAPDEPLRAPCGKWNEQSEPWKTIYPDKAPSLDWEIVPGAI